MAIPVFPPAREDQLLAWSANFSAKITASPSTFSLTAAQATAYATLHNAYASALALASAPETNSKGNVNAKNEAKRNLLRGPGGARQLVDIVQAAPTTTNAMRDELNIRIKDTEPTPVPVPTTAPAVDILSVSSTTVRVRIHESKTAAKRGKPVGVKGATVLWFVGENPPIAPTEWTFGGSTTKNMFTVTLPPTTPGGSRVWVTAFWFNTKMQSGPATDPPVSVNIPGALSMAA